MNEQEMREEMREERTKQSMWNDNVHEQHL